MARYKTTLRLSDPDLIQTLERVAEMRTNGNNTEAVRELLRVAASSEVGDIREKESCGPVDAIERALDDYSASVGDASEYDLHVEGVHLTKDAINDILDQNAEPEINPEHVPALDHPADTDLPGSAKAKTRVIAAMERYLSRDDGPQDRAASRDRVEDLVRNYLGNSNYYLRDGPNWADYPGRVMAIFENQQFNSVEWTTQEAYAQSVRDELERNRERVSDAENAYIAEQIDEQEADELIRRTRSLLLDGESPVIDHVDACDDITEDDVYAVVKRAEVVAEAVRHSDDGDQPALDEVDEDAAVEDAAANGASAQS